jgi:predicted ABC-type ATPase
LGYYINADDIVRQFREDGFSFKDFNIQVTKRQLWTFATKSGLLSDEFTEKEFDQSYHIRLNRLFLKDLVRLDQVGQIVARYLREAMLERKRRFSFETVFSHPSNIGIMKQAVESGYKVYLYFVSTESPEINKFRVAYRVSQNGHDVPPDKIVSRYFRSLDLLFEATQICHQAYFFDNSKDNMPFTLVAHCKRVGDRMNWDRIPKRDVAAWFKKYYQEKVLSHPRKGLSNL